MFKIVKRACSAIRYSRVSKYIHKYSLLAIRRDLAREAEHPSLLGCRSLVVYILKGPDKGKKYFGSPSFYQVKGAST